MARSGLAALVGLLFWDVAATGRPRWSRARKRRARFLDAPATT